MLRRCVCVCVSLLPHFMSMSLDDDDDDDDGYGWATRTHNKPTHNTQHTSTQIDPSFSVSNSSAFSLLAHNFLANCAKAEILWADWSIFSIRPLPYFSQCLTILCPPTHRDRNGSISTLPIVPTLNTFLSLSLFQNSTLQLVLYMIYALSGPMPSIFVSHCENECVLYVCVCVCRVTCCAC